MLSAFAAETDAKDLNSNQEAKNEQGTYNICRYIAM